MSQIGGRMMSDEEEERPEWDWIKRRKK